MEWRDIPGYEGIYEVSDIGEVRTKEGKTTYSKRHKGPRKWKQRVLRQRADKGNSLRVNLWKDGKERTWLVHRLVALAFIPTVEGRNYVNHKDGNRLNNQVNNLEWCDHKENNNHAFDTGLMTTNKRVTLIDEQTGEPHHFRSMAKASEFLGRNPGYISARRDKRKVDGYLLRMESREKQCK